MGGQNIEAVNLHNSMAGDKEMGEGEMAIRSMPTLQAFSFLIFTCRP